MDDARPSEPAPPQPPDTERPVSDRSGGDLTLVVTPLGAFSGGALVVAGLALAFALGRRLPPDVAPRTSRRPIERLEAVFDRPPINYQDLTLDNSTNGRGTAVVPPRRSATANTSRPARRAP